MPGSADQRLETLLVEALREAPRDALELRDHLAAKARTLISGREGALHALLHRLLRRGTIRTMTDGPRGLVLYGLPGDAEASAEASVEAAPAHTLPASRPALEISAAARKVASGARRGVHRERIARDVHAHMVALERTGHPEAFGTVRAMRHLLRRVDRRLPTVAVVGRGSDSWLRFLWHEGAWIVGAIVLFLVLRAWIAEVFYIPSDSMVPTLVQGDRVVVTKVGGKSMPERWSIVTFKRKDTTYVKRVAGLGGEAFSLSGGDVFVDSALERKPDGVREALRFPYTTWSFEAADPTGWRRESAGDAVHWTYSGDRLWGGGPGGAGAMGRDVPLRDVYATLEAERPAGTALELELSWAPDDLVAEARASLLLVVSDTGATLQLRHGAEPRVVWDDLPAPAAGPVVLHLSQVDGVVRASAGGVAFAEREIGAEMPRAGGPLGLSVHARGAGARPRALALEKDVHYTMAGELAVPIVGHDELPGSHVFHIPPDAVFMLGDNTYDSRDSRFTTMGAVRLAELIGPVRFRIWPPGRVGGVR